MNGKLYLKNFVFPVYEWYFLLSLFVTAKNHPETRDKTTHEKLLILQQLLADYIEKHHEIIEDPFHGEKDDIRPVLSNYGSQHLIRPVYLSHDISSRCLKYNENIAEVLSALKPFNTYKNL